MAPRIERLRETPGIRPTVQAGAVHSFTPERPDYIAPPPSTTKWSQLSEALTKIEPSLQNFVRGTAERISEEKVAEGMKLFEENRVGWKEFTKANPQFAGANPWLKRGYDKAHLADLGLQFKTQAQAALLERGDVLNADDPMAFEKFMDEYRMGWLQENVRPDVDPKLVSEALTPHMNQAHQSLGSYYANRRMEENLKKNTQQLGTYIESAVDAVQVDPNINWADPEAHDVALETVAVDIQERLDDMISHGLPASVANSQVIKTVAAIAERENNADLLDVLDRIETGSGVLGKTQEAVAIRESVEDALFAEEQSRTRFSWAMKDRQDKEEAEAVHDAAFAAFFADPSMSIRQYVKETGIDPKHVATITKVRDAVQTSMVYNPPMTEDRYKTGLRDEILALSGKLTYAQIAQRAANGEYTPSQTQHLISTVKSAKQRFGDEIDDLMYPVRSMVGRYFGGSTDELGMIATGNPEKDALAMEATGLIMRKVLMASQEDGGNDPAALRIKAHDIAIEVLNTPRFNQGRDVLKSYEVDTNRLPLDTEEEFNPAQVFSFPPDQVPWQNQGILGTVDDLQMAVAAYNENGSGIIPAIASYLGVDPLTLVQQQGAMYGFEAVDESAVEQESPAPQEGGTDAVQSIFNVINPYLETPATSENLKKALAELGSPDLWERKGLGKVPIFEDFRRFIEWLNSFEFQQIDQDTQILWPSSKEE